jgi:TonB family protein
MNASRTRRILWIALGVSLLLHLILAVVLRWPEYLPEQKTETVSILTRTHAMQIVHAMHTPVPHPPQPRASSVPRLKHVVPVVVAHAKTGPAIAAEARPTPAPTSAPTGARCTTPNVPAALAASPPPADIPDAARAQAVNGTTRVQVRLDATGSVLDADVISSSGSPALDAAARTMALDASYDPAYARCAPVAADYMFSAKWVAW